MPSPLVSVIIPIYNVESYLAQCLDSVLAQSYENLEILLINDGSTDSSGAIAKAYADKDPRIHLFTQANAGQSAARNLGLEHAQGEYVSFIDSDDYIDRDFIKELVEIASPDTLAYNFNVVFEQNTESVRHNKDRVVIGKFAIDQHIISALDFFVCNGLFTMKLIRDNKLKFMEGKICEDADFLFCYLVLVDYIHCIDSGAYHYRQRTGSTTWKLADDRVVSLDRIEAFEHIVLWSKKHKAVGRGLPFQVLYSLHPSHNNANQFITKAKQVLQELQIPQELLEQDKKMQQFMQAKDSKDFFLKRYLDSARGFKRYFRLRIKPKDREALFVCFGRVILYYRKEQ